MNPTNRETAGAQPPPAVVEPTGSREAGPARPEQAPSAPERAPSAPPAASPAMTTIPLPTAQPAAPAPAPAGVTVTAQTASLPVPDDNDLIEKEWVNRAKQIVERNRNDPYKQSEELTVFKADYMKKRYDKTIKVSQ